MSEINGSEGGGGALFKDITEAIEGAALAAVTATEAAVSMALVEEFLERAIATMKSYDITDPDYVRAHDQAKQARIVIEGTARLTLATAAAIATLR